MKKIYASLLAMLLTSTVAFAQVPFEQEIEIEWLPESVILPPSPLTYQVLFIGGHDEVQTVDENGQPNGTALAKQWHDFIGFTPDNDSDDMGWISINHEMIFADDKIGDGGGMTAFKIRRADDGSIEVVDQTLADGRSGKFFNVDFVNTVGETGMNCGGITSSADGRIWTAEEWFRTSNMSIFDNRGSAGVRDTADFTVASDIQGDFDGQVIKKFENFNWMVEIDPREAKAIRKQYNWGRQPFEGGVVMPDNQTVFTGADATPGILTKFVADTPGDFTKGTTYAYKQSEDGESGSWVEIDNTSMENMLNYSTLAFQNGATMFNRLEWVAYNKANGKVYLTETGRDNPAGRFQGGLDLGGVHAKHTLDRAAAQGVEVTSEEYWDFYGRILELDPVTNKVSVFLEAGPYFAESPEVAAYPDKHLTNPDGLTFLHTQGKDYMVICEDLNGTSMGRTPAGIDNRTCELFILDMDGEASIDNLLRVSVVPMGAEVTGVFATPDGKTLLVNSQHPSSDNPFPYNNSLTYAINGWDGIGDTDNDDDVTSVEDELTNELVFSVFPNPVARELRFNRVMDVALYDNQGRRIRVARQVSSLNVHDLPAGAYYLKNDEGQVRKVVIEK